MADRPILMSAPMVLACLREVEQPGTGKTQTRRILKPQPGPCDHTPWAKGTSEFQPSIDEDGVHCAMCGNGVQIARTKSGVRGIPLRFAQGDRLWIREAWRTEARFDKLKPSEVPAGSLISYEADYIREPNDGCRGRYRHGRFMMRWMSRLAAPVNGVRVEQLQTISEVDAVAEGVLLVRRSEPERGWLDYVSGDIERGLPTARDSYRSLWSSLNEPGEFGWAENPWVTVTSFNPERRNIDAKAITEGPASCLS